MENDFVVIFDNVDLNTIPYVFFSRRNPNSEADLDLVTHDLVRRDGAVLTSIKRKPKRIALEGFIVAPTRTSYEEALDTLKFLTSNPERYLRIIQAGSERKYIATKENIIIEHIEGGNARVNISFVCLHPYGSESILTTDEYTATTTPYGITHVFLGTAYVKPVFTVTLNSLTDGTTKHVGVGNSQTGQQVQVTRSWTAGDTVVFDLENQKVYVNSAISDYNGVFPEFKPTQANSYYYDSLSARNATIGLSYAKQYL